MDEQQEVDFCQLVAARVEEQFQVAGSADLCFSLLEARVIPEEAGVDEAARIVALHLA